MYAIFSVENLIGTDHVAEVGVDKRLLEKYSVEM
jgi:hypothetical protein